MISKIIEYLETEKRINKAAIHDGMSEEQKDIYQDRVDMLDKFIDDIKNKRYNE